MSTRKKKIRVLKFSIIFTGLTNLLGYYLVKKGELSKEEYNADLFRGTITQAVSSLGIIYLQEQERQEQRRIIELRARGTYIDPEDINKGRVLKKEHREKKLAKQVDKMLNSKNKDIVKTIKKLQEQI